MASGLGGTSLGVVTGKASSMSGGSVVNTPPQASGGGSSWEHLSASLSLPVILVVGGIVYFALKSYGGGD